MVQIEFAFFFLPSAPPPYRSEPWYEVEFLRFLLRTQLVNAYQRI